MKAAVIILALTITSAGVFADQQTPPIRLTLDDAITRGLEASHRIGELRAREEAARAAVAGREAAARPQVALLGGYRRTNHIPEFAILMPNGVPQVIFPDIPDNYRTRIDLQWPIYSGGRVDALARAAQAETSAAVSDIEAARLDLRLEITRAYWAVATAHETVKVVEEGVRRSGAHLDDVRTRLDAGLIPPNDVLSVQAEHAHQQVLLAEAQNMSAVSETDLRRLTGIADDTPIELAEDLTPRDQPAPEVSAMVAEARSGRPDRRAITQRIDSAAAREAAAASALRPAFGVAGGFDYLRPNQRILPPIDAWKTSWDVSLNASWSIWDGGRARADVAEAAATTRAARERLAEFDTMLSMEVRQRLLDLSSARATVPSANESAIAAAEARRVVGERFSAGVATSTDVIDAQVALLQSELERTRAFANVRLAEARLARAVGK